MDFRLTAILLVTSVMAINVTVADSGRVRLREIFSARAVVLVGAVLAVDRAIAPLVDRYALNYSETAIAE